tara:strand:+ start:425 stop:664 length:240 start_codon:yes stop_codon:yes gene_type:complete
MKQPWKIECFSETGVKIISNLINANNGNFIIEGLAIVTDYSFNQDQTDMTIACVSKTTPFEDLTITDLELFNECLMVGL